MNLSFSGCGFLGIYHLGVGKTFARDGKRFIAEVKRYGGASAGALIASLFAVYGADEEIVERCLHFTTDLAREMKSKTFGVFTPGVELLKPLESFMEELFPQDAHLRASGRLFVSVTNAETKENELVSEFSSRENLIQFLLASSCIPHITASASITINGKKYCDGGLTDNLPNFPEGKTVKVSPFEGKHDISPSISALCKRGGTAGSPNGAHFTVVNQSFKVSLDNLTRGLHIFSPPSVDVLTRYYHQGSEDARRFLIDRGYFEPHDRVADGGSSSDDNNGCGGYRDDESMKRDAAVPDSASGQRSSPPDIESPRRAFADVLGKFSKDGSFVCGFRARGTSVDAQRKPRETSVD